MTDILIRGVPERIVKAINTAAVHQGLSRNEYLQRTLASTVQAGGTTVSLNDLQTLAEAFAEAAGEGSDAEASREPCGAEVAIRPLFHAPAPATAATAVSARGPVAEQGAACAG